MPAPRKYDRSLYLNTEGVLQQEAYALSMAKSKICIFDSSVLKIGLRKYAEALASGCVIAADLPYDYEGLLDDLVIPLNASMTWDEINGVLVNALKDEKEMKRRSAKGILLARKHMVCERKTDLAIDMVEEWHAGFRGYYYTLGHRIGCRDYLLGYKNPNPWCRKL